MDFKELREISHRYRTNIDLLKNLIQWFGREQTIDILKMHPKDIKNTARINFLKCSRETTIKRLNSEGIKANPLSFLSEGIEITKGWNKIGSSQCYLRGEIIPQGLGSMLSVHALDPQPNELILDMAAAPGGKTSFIGERMKNKGILIANDPSKPRLISLINNLSRHNIHNTVITNFDGRQLNYKNLDRILLDAPCTGEGLIVSNVKRRKSKSLVNHFDMQKIQTSLLKRAISMLKIGGICIYSTCSLSPIENEFSLQSILNNKVELINLDIIGEEGFTNINEEFSKVKRLIPSKYACDGFFIAKLRRIR